MSTISAKGWGQEISQFNTKKYGGIKDLGLYIDYHSNNKGISAWNNNGIFKVGDTYYFVTTGDGNQRLTKDNVYVLFNYYNDKGSNTMGANTNGAYTRVPNGTILKITNPDLIQAIKANADENRSGRIKLGTVDGGYNNIQLEYNPQNNPQNETQSVQQKVSTPQTNSGGSSGYNPYIDDLKTQLNTKDNTIN